VTLLDRPALWLGAQGRGTQAIAALVGALLLFLAIPMWADVFEHVDASIQCTTPCQDGGQSIAGALQVLTVGTFVLAGAFLLGGALACLLRPQGRLDARADRLLQDAKTHFATGGLSVEAFQATRDRLHAQAESRSAHQLGLAFGLSAAPLAVATLVAAGGALDMMASLRHATVPLPATRIVEALTLLLAGSCAACSWQLARAARAASRHAGAERQRLGAMLRDLEMDLLDEVRRFHLRRATAHTMDHGVAMRDGLPPAQTPAGEALSWRPAP